jgi:hypothetical protein
MISDTIQRGSSAYFRRRLERKGIALDKLHAAIFMRLGASSTDLRQSPGSPTAATRPSNHQETRPNPRRLLWDDSPCNPKLQQFAVGRAGNIRSSTSASAYSPVVANSARFPTRVDNDIVRLAATLASTRALAVNTVPCHGSIII